MNFDLKDFTPAFIDVFQNLDTDFEKALSFVEFTEKRKLSQQEQESFAAQFLYQKLKDLGQWERINNLYRCKDKATKRKVWFRPNAIQAYYYKRKTKRDLILKPRQIGFTQLTVVIGVDNCLFEEGSSEGLMAHKKEKAVQELFQRVRDTFDWFLEDWGEFLPIQTNKDSANKMIIEKIAGMNVKSSYEVSHDFRSASLTRLHISEASRVDIERAMGSIDSVPHAGQVIMETTANGRDEVFYSKWMETKDSKRKKDVYVWENHFFPWFHHYPEPGQDLRIEGTPKWDDKEKILLSLGANDQSLLWRRWKIKENFSKDPERFDEEYPTDDETCFLGGSSVVGRKYLLRLQRFIKPAMMVGSFRSLERWFEFVERDGGFVSIWQKPKEGEQYVIGADPSEGVGKDKAAAVVKSRRTGVYVARVHSAHLPPEEFAETLYHLARFYNQAFICFELNNHGFVVKDRLVNTYGYTNLYRRREMDKITGNWKDEVGFRTTGGNFGSKEKLVMNFVSRLREGRLTFSDEELLTECINFQRDESGRLGAVSGANDDLFIAACLTEEMDDALGPLVYDEDNDGDFRLDPITGFPT